METPIDSTIVEHRSGGMFSAEIWCNSLLHWIISKYQPQIAATLSKSFIFIAKISFHPWFAKGDASTIPHFLDEIRVLHVQIRDSLGFFVSSPLSTVPTIQPSQPSHYKNAKSQSVMITSYKINPLKSILPPCFHCSPEEKCSFFSLKYVKIC